MMRPTVVALALGLLGGCDLFDQAAETWGGLTNPLVAEGIVLGVEPPESDDIDLSGTDFQDGTGMTLFLADARSVDDLEEAPVEGANVTLQGVPAEEQAPGTYLIVPGGALTYQNDATWNLRVGIGGDAATASVHLPPPANVTVPERHDANQPLTLNLGGGGFPGVLGVVIDVESGEATWSNKPETVRDYYDFTRGSTMVTTLEIPGTAFPADGLYAVGVAGVEHTEGASFDDMNTALSTVMSGKMRFSPVLVGDLPF